MFDFTSPVMGSGNADHGEYNQDKASSQLNLANLILVDLVYLIKNGATLETKLKYGGTQPSVFIPFFTAFREIFDLTSHLIDKKVQDEIEEWFDTVDVRSTKSLNDEIARGLKLSRKLKMEIVKLGMLKIFEPPIQPPFMLDYTIAKVEEEAKEEKNRQVDGKITTPAPVPSQQHTRPSPQPPTAQAQKQLKPSSGRIPGVRNKNLRV